MTVLATYNKQPSERLDYDFDYSLFLMSADTIESAVFKVETLVESGEVITVPNPLEIDTEIIDTTFTKAWVRGGEIGYTYKISCTATTAHGRTKEDEIKIRVKEY